MLEMSAQPELLARLERLAAERHTDRDTLLSEAIAAYLEREEAQSIRERTVSVSTNTENASHTAQSAEIFDLPPLPAVVHLRSPRVVYDEGATRLPKVTMVQK